MQPVPTSSHLFRDHHRCAIVLYNLGLYTNAQHYYHIRPRETGLQPGMGFLLRWVFFSHPLVYSIEVIKNQQSFALTYHLFVSFSLDNLALNMELLPSLFCVIEISGRASCHQQLDTIIIFLQVLSRLGFVIFPVHYHILLATSTVYTSPPRQ